MQGFLVIRVFGLRGIRFTRLGKITSIKKNLRFMTRTQLYDARKCELTQKPESQKQKFDGTRVKPARTSGPSGYSQQAQTRTLLCLLCVSFRQIVHDVILFIFLPFYYFLLHKI